MANSDRVEVFLTEVPMVLLLLRDMVPELNAYNVDERNGKWYATNVPIERAAEFEAQIAQARTL